MLVHAIVLPGVLFQPAYGQPGERMQDASRCAPDIGKEVVTQEDILRHGFFRLADVLAFSTHWSATSLDGYHWQAAPAGFPGGTERWSLYIDDAPVAPRALGRNRLNALPVSLSDVACVEIVSGPDMQGPAPHRDGVLRIYTKQPAFGLSMGAGIAAGNEINDPGPFRYTLPETVNIDRTGPIEAVSLSVGKTTGQGHASGRFDEQHVVDEALRDRPRRLYAAPNTKPHIRTRALGFSGIFGQHPWRQRIAAGFAHTRDIVFFQETGLEIPAGHRIAHWGAAGRLPFWRGGAVRYAASSTRDDFPLRQNKEDIDLDWAQRVFSAEADLRMRRLRLGGRAQAFRAKTTQPLRDETLLDLRLFGGIDLARRPQERMLLGLEWALRAQHAGRRGAVAYVSVRRGAFRFAGSYGAARPDPGNLWFWQRRGYALPYGAFRDMPSGRGPLPRRLALHAGWIRARPNGASGSLLIFYRGFRNELRPEYAIAPPEQSDQPGQSGFDTVTRLAEGGRGHTGGISAALTFRPARGVRQRISGAFEAVRRRPAPRTYAEPAPRLRLVSVTEWTFADRFSLSAFAQCVSAMRWPEYREAAPDTWRLAPRLLAGATAAKRMAGDRLNVSLGLRNALNEPARFHPAGAVFYMEFYFSAAARFTSAAGF